MSVILDRWGNSVGLRLPKPLLEQLGLKEGSKVEVKVEHNRLVIEPSRRRRSTIADCWKASRPMTRPGEVDWGPPVGKEVW
jgi:antitoxin MazE